MTTHLSALPELPDNGIDVLLTTNPQHRTRFPAIALLDSGPQGIYYPADIAELNPDIQIVWTWPGQWRNDVFVTTAGQVSARLLTRAL